MQRPEEIFHKVGKAVVFSKLDLRQGFLQIPLAEGHQAKTCYWAGNRLMAYRRMSYGLRNASTHFQRVIKTEFALAGLDHCAMAFIDDVLIWSDSAEQYERMSPWYSTCCNDAVFGPNRINPSLAQGVIKNLGHNFSTFGISPHQAKVAAIMALKPPKIVSELRTQLGFVKCYRCYVPGMSQRMANLKLLLKKGEPWTCGPAQQAAHDGIKAVFNQEGVVL